MIGYAFSLPSPPRVGRGASWREEAIGAYRQTERERALALRADLAARVRALTGVPVGADSVSLSRETGEATVTVDGAVFRLAHGVLRLVRPCAHCGTGQFLSGAIEDRADLGGALGAWMPLHEECQPEEAIGSL
ncbi:MAG: hypothetical protein U0232_16760 [Thermomicrobiales bacterium]